MDKDISNMMNKFADMMGVESPDKLNNFAHILQGSNSSNSNNNTDNSSSSTFDMDTLLKMKSVMEKMNGASDPRSNLLRSLKPYLKESRKSKVDQYINLFNMSKIMEAFKDVGGVNK